MENKFFYQILEENKTSLHDVCKALDFDLLNFEKSLKNNTVSWLEYKMIARYLKVDIEDLYQNEYDLILKKIKNLLKEQNTPFVLMCEQLGLSNSSLYKSFSNKTITISTLKKIAGYIGVSSSCFFEDRIFEKFTNEIVKYPENPDLKGFMIGFSRDISNGMPLQLAVNKNINSNFKNEMPF